MSPITISDILKETPSFVHGCKSSDNYTTRLDGRDCYVTFPKNANLSYIYVQETILKKVKEVIFKRAQVVIPQVLQRVSERINAQYRNCIVVKALRGFWALYDFDTQDVTFCAGCPRRVLRRSASMNSPTALSEATTKTFMTRCSNSAARRCTTLTTIFGKKNVGCIWICRV